MQKSLTKEELALNQHVEDLRERMRLLRKKNNDIHICVFIFYYNMYISLLRSYLHMTSKK